MHTKPAPSKVVEVICQGSPKEMGLAQGAGVQNKIHAARQALTKLEAFRLQQPWWLPYRAYRWLAEHKASRFLARCRDNPDMSQRLAGIAEGAGVSLKAICLFNALEPLLSSVGGCTACPGACSAVAVRGPRSATGEAIVAHNFDYLPLVQPFYTVRESRPQGKLRAFEFTTAPLAGAVDGMNERGLCITYNYGFTTDEPSAPAAPISMAISEALGRCGTVAEAADWITSRPRWGGGLLMLGDASGDISPPWSYRVHGAICADQLRAQMCCSTRMLFPVPPCEKSKSLGTRSIPPTLPLPCGGTGCINRLKCGTNVSSNYWERPRFLVPMNSEL